MLFPHQSLRRILIYLSFISISAAQTADLSHLVVVGDSLSAGVQNISLLDSQQPNGYAAVIAKQANVPMVLPLIKYPGLPNVLQIVGFNPLPVLQPVPGAPPSPARDRPNDQPTNLSIPGITVAAALAPPAALPPPLRAWAQAVLQSAAYPSATLSAVQEALALHPSTIKICPLGSNDALLYALTGGAEPLTPLPAFTGAFQAVLGSLAQSGATMVVANIPTSPRLRFSRRSRKSRS